MNGYNGVYLMGDYPDAERFKAAALLGMERFDFLEVGVPFSDPVADGPVIARAAEAVLERGFRLDDLARSVSDIRAKAPDGKRIYFMTYANPVHNRGLARFADLSKRAGADGVIVPDVPFVESAPFRDAFGAQGLDYINFATPENTPGQIREIARAARGFLYFVSIRGITGSGFTLDSSTRSKIRQARRSSAVPVVLGFGIRSADDARAAAALAGGFIVGTGVVEALGSGGIEGYGRYLDSLFAGE
ncbi:MAG TPA: tryptophan synthase subunit alpha [Spirochaetota bacterium]|nr:tryptophan synthase subunit alpha [Spirochaetota bacterium]